MRGKATLYKRILACPGITPAYAGKRCIDFLDMVST